MEAVLKKYVILFIIFASVICIRPALAQFPIHLGGFTIGDDIALYEDKLDLSTCRESMYNPYFGEGKIKPMPGFKSGNIAYGLCDRPNKIVRIKLKFDDASRRFYNTLLRKYKKALGEPTEYKGDPFQTVIAWKWSFMNEKKQTLSLILQHNISVEDEKIGNAVKLTLTDQFMKERNCYLEKHPEKERPQNTEKISKKELWRSFIPY